MCMSLAFWKRNGIEIEPVSKDGVQMYDKLFFLRREGATFEIRSQVINPTKATTFATPLQTSILSNVTPAALSIG